jgi:hypothetical protein
MITFTQYKLIYIFKLFLTLLLLLELKNEQPFFN